MLRLRHVCAEPNLHTVGYEAWQNCFQLQILKRRCPYKNPHFKEALRSSQFWHLWNRLVQLMASEASHRSESQIVTMRHRPMVAGQYLVFFCTETPCVQRCTGHLVTSSKVRPCQHSLGLLGSFALSKISGHPDTSSDMPTLHDRCRSGGLERDGLMGTVPEVTALSSLAGVAVFVHHCSLLVLD